MPFFNPQASQTYQPGLLEQDVFTLPLEAGLIGVMSEFYTPGQPLWPFQNERAFGPQNPTRHTKRMLAIGAGSIATPLLAGLSYTNEQFPLGIVFRAWVHAHLVTEMATTFAKVTFQRHRPFYDSAAQRGTPSADSHFSFFSGHASHAFAFATFSSSLIFNYVDYPIVPYAYTVAIFTTATWIASARAIDGQHRWSDVGTAAVVGTVLSRVVFSQMLEVVQKQKDLDENLSRPSPRPWSFTPGFADVESPQKSALSFSLTVKKDL